MCWAVGTQTKARTYLAAAHRSERTLTNELAELELGKFELPRGNGLVLILLLLLLLLLMLLLLLTLLLLMVRACADGRR